MSRFIKVVEWDGPNGFHFEGKVLYLNVDSIQTFYQMGEWNECYFNFSNYGEGLNVNNAKQPIKIIAQNGKEYYSPIKLKEAVRTSDEIDDRFEILDL